MAKTIPQLTDATTVNAADELIVQQGGITKRATANEFLNGAATVTSTSSSTGRTLKDRFADVVNVKDFGAVGDGVADDTAALQAAINYATPLSKQLVFPKGTYLFNTLSYVGTGTANWKAVGRAVLRSTKASPDTSSFDADFAIRLGGEFVAGLNTVGDKGTGSTVIEVSGSHAIEAGDIVELRSTRVIQTSENRSQAREGQVAVVEEVSGQNIRIKDALMFPAFNKANLTDTIASAASTTSFTFSTLTTPNEETAALMTFTSGTLNGQSRYISRYDPATKTATFESQGAWPSLPSNGDAFKIEWETLVAHYKPLTVIIAGDFTITREPTYNATAGDLGFRGLLIRWVNECDITGATIENFSHVGVDLTHAYKPYISNCWIYNANRAFSIFGGTGYGVAVSNSFAPSIESCWFVGCRRGVDFGGTQSVTWGGKCSNITVSGGGRDYTGEPFHPVGATRNSGCGSHGAGYNSLYADNIFMNVYQGVILRGMHETVVGNSASGRMFAFAEIIAGSQHRIVSNAYMSSIGHKQATAYDTSSIVPPAWFVQIRADRVYSDASFYIENNNAVVTNGFVRFNGVATLAPTLILANNLCNFDRRKTDSSSIVKFLSSVQAYTIKDLVDKGGNVVDVLSMTNIIQVYKYDLFNSITPETGSILRLGDNQYLATIAQGEMATLRLDEVTNCIFVSLHDYQRDRTYSAASVLLNFDRSTDSSPLQASNKTKVVIAADAPVDPLDETDDRITLFLAGDGLLYIVNRITNPARVVVTVNAPGF
jgi:hypothetical protein